MAGQARRLCHSVEADQGAGGCAIAWRLIKGLAAVPLVVIGWGAAVVARLIESTVFHWTRLLWLNIYKNRIFL